MEEMQKHGRLGRAARLSLHWLLQGYGYDITGADVWESYRATLAAAERQGRCRGEGPRAHAGPCGAPASAS